MLYITQQNNFVIIEFSFNNLLTVNRPQPPEVSPTHSCVTVWPSAPQLTSAEINILTCSCMTNRFAVCLTRCCPYLTCRSRLSSHTCCVTAAPRLSNVSCYSRYRGILTALYRLQGDTNSLLTMRRSTTFQRPSKEIHVPKPLMSHKSTEEIPTLPFS